MQIVESPSAMHVWSAEQRSLGQRIGLVPTMGALHEGHLGLIAEARRHCDVVVVSIFVNPLQFNRSDDFEGYPRPRSDDIEQCRAHGVDAIYAPTVAEMYPSGFDTHVEPGAVAEGLEGAGRPGHFRGVATVVTKLCNAVRPDVAVFGEKDYQQLAVIRHLVADLDMGIDIIEVATVRESDGLALSSRNRRLDPSQRVAAAIVPRALVAVQDAFWHGTIDAEKLRETAVRIIADEPQAHLEYVEVVDRDTLRPLQSATPDASVVIAVWFGQIRLIDNVALSRL